MVVYVANATEKAGAVVIGMTASDPIGTLRFLRLVSLW